MIGSNATSVLVVDRDSVVVVGDICHNGVEQQSRIVGNEEFQRFAFDEGVKASLIPHIIVLL